MSKEYVFQNNLEVGEIFTNGFGQKRFIVNINGYYYLYLVNDTVDKISPTNIHRNYLTIDSLLRTEYKEHINSIKKLNGEYIYKEKPKEFLVSHGDIIKTYNGEPLHVIQIDSHNLNLFKCLDGIINKMYNPNFSMLDSYANLYNHPYTTGLEFTKIGRWLR